MRFSLAMLLLLTLLSGSLMALWIRREPWELVAVHLAEGYAPNASRAVSPDNTRKFGMLLHDPAKMSEESAYLEILDAVNEKILYRLPTRYSFPQEDFSDNDIITLYFERTSQTSSLEYTQYTYRRRFPEWWWGHFYRPEVWLSAALFITIVIRLVRARRPIVAAPQISSLPS